MRKFCRACKKNLHGLLISFACNGMQKNITNIRYCSASPLPTPHTREQQYKDLFHINTLEFEARLDRFCHLKCIVCCSVSIRFKNLKPDDRDEFICPGCLGSNIWSAYPDKTLPVWFDDNGIIQYFVPEELKCLREGEKLLIQQISVYVPLQHLSYGQVGARGHIVSFPQDVLSVCRTLPRLPGNVQAVKVIKNFKLSDGSISSNTFRIRRPVVLAALRWLKKYNKQYSDIDICEDNLSWITNGDEQELPLETWEEPIAKTGSENEDLGPTGQRIEDHITGPNAAIEPCYGIANEFNTNMPKKKDNTVIDALKAAEMKGKLLSTGSLETTIQFPYVSSEPVCEYSEPYLMECAFPWLFPGGSGGFLSGPNPRPDIKVWMQKMLLYMDGRFDQDRLWSFFALNYTTRHTNQGSGSFYVNSFYEHGPKTLEKLQEQVSAGQLEWLNRICYFSQCVTGSASYWRARKREVFSWISYHLEEGNGVPTFFITLSCAEYHWQDIERLIQDKCCIAGIEIPDFTKGKWTI
jgi:Helitron helicase-like domain at N-terminus